MMPNPTGHSVYGVQPNKGKVKVAGMLNPHGAQNGLGTG